MGSSTETTAGRRRLALPASAALALLALLTALLALLAPRDVHAGEHIVLSSYQEREGLQNLTPTCLLQDRRSVLWICTENGLFRFDGFQVHAEPTPPAIGTVLWGGRLDPLGRLWLTTDRGLFVRLPPASTGHADETDRPARWVGIVRPDGKPLDIVLAQQFDIDAQGGLVAFDRDFRYWTASIDDATASATVQARPLAVPAHLRSRGTPFVDSSPLRLLGGQLWFGCGEVLCSWDRRQPAVTRWAQAQGLPDDSWATLFVGRDGSLWARGRTHLARLAPGAQRFEVTAAPSPSPTWEASSPTAEDAQGRILTATEHGLARWDGRAWQAWSREEGLPDAALRVLLTDADGALWLGASGQGIHRWIGYGEVDHWTRDSGLPSGVVFRIVQDGSGRVWAFTRQGAAWFDAARHRFVALRGTPAAGGDFSGAVVDDAGDLWWLDNGQLMTVKAGSATARPVLRDPSLLVLLRGHGGTLFLVAKDRVEALVPSAARPRRTPIAPGLPGGLPPIELFSDGTTDWFVNTARQAYRVQGDGWVPLLDVRGQRATGASPVLSGGLLWTMDDNGIVARELSGDRVRDRQRLPRAAFGGADPMWLRRGPAGGLWLGTDRGVFMLDGAGAWRGLLDRTSGLVWNDTNNDSFLLDASGDAWIGTSAGLTRVRAARPVSPAPATLRADLLEFGTLRFHAPPRDPVPWAARQLRVTLGTPGVSLARSLRIEYRLSADVPWRPGEGASIDIGALEAGSHVLEARVAGRVPLEPPGPVLRLPFEVAPPWWRSTGARLGFAAALALLYWLLALWTQRRARARRRELERAIEERTAELEASQAALHRLSGYNAMALEDERKRVSRELHDELGQQLAALRLEISVLRARAAKAALPDVTQLDLLHERVDRLIAAVRGVVSQLRPPALDGGLTAALRWLASEFSRDTGVPCAVTVPAEANELGADAATLMFRIAQESLNNVRRHAAASHVELGLTRRDAQWTLTVRDDGRGFDPAARTGGHGVLGMRERARLMGGTLDIVSAPGAGTTVELRVVPGTPHPPPTS